MYRYSGCVWPVQRITGDAYSRLLSLPYENDGWKERIPDSVMQFAVKQLNIISVKKISVQVGYSRSGILTRLHKMGWKALNPTSNTNPMWVRIT